MSVVPASLSVQGRFSTLKSDKTKRYMLFII